MPASLQDYLPDSREATYSAQRRAQAAKAQEPQYGRLAFTGGLVPPLLADAAVSTVRTFGDAIQSEWAGAWAIRQSDRSRHSFNPTFTLTRDALGRLTDGLPEEWWSEFGNAVSAEHAETMRAQLLNLRDVRARLSQAGWGGGVARIAANIFDPVAIAGSVLTAGLAGPAVYGTKLVRMQRLLRGGLVAGATEGAIEAYLTTQDPDRGATDIIWATGAAFALGGGVNVWAGSRLDRAGRAMMKQAELNEAIEDGLDITDAGKLYFRDQLADAEKARLRDLIVDAADLSADEAAAMKTVAPQTMVDYINTRRVPDTTYNGADFNAVDVTDAKSTFAGLRFGMAGLLGQSKVPGLRRVASMLIDDALPKTDGSFNVMPASVWVNLEQKVRMSRFYRTANAEFEQWAVERGLTVQNRRAGKEEFLNEVGKAVHWPRGRYTSDARVNAVADRVRDDKNELLQLGKRYGVKGFENIDDNDQYIMRLWSPAKIERAIADHGYDEVERLFYEAIRRANGELTEEEAQTMARGFLKALRNIDDYDDITKARIFSQDQTENLMQILKKELPGLSDDKLNSILFRVAPRPGDKNMPSRARRRMVLDETHAIHTGGGNKLEIVGLTENNAAVLMNIYTKQMLGHSAMAEIYRAYEGRGLEPAPGVRLAEPAEPGGGAVDITPGVKVRAADRNNVGTVTSVDADKGLAVVDFVNRTSGAKATRTVKIDDLQVVGDSGVQTKIENFNQLVARLTEEAKAAGVLTSKADQRRFANDINRLTTSYRSVIGLPLGKDSVAADSLRLMRAYNYIRIAGQMGIIQAVEAGMIIANAGLRATMAAMPVLPQIFKRARNGELANDSLREIEAILGTGTDRLRHEVIARWESHDAVEHLDAARPMARISKGLERAGRFMNDINFMHPINIALQRSAGAAAMQQWAGLAAAGKLPSPKRLAAMGLTEADGKAIIGQLKKHGTWEDGLFGQRVRTANITAWDDQFAASKFIGALNVWSRRVIQENDIGQLSQWMTTDVGRTIMQFRNFTVVAWEKQFLFNLHMRDWAAFMGLAWTMTFGALAYIARTYSNAPFGNERAKHLKERLTLGRIATNAYGMSGYSSLMPDFIDQGGRILDLGTPFRTGRNEIGEWLDNPSYDLGNGVVKSLAGMFGSWQDDQRFTDKDLRNSARVMPFQNFLGAKVMIEALATQLPESDNE